MSHPEEQFVMTLMELHLRTLRAAASVCTPPRLSGSSPLSISFSIRNAVSLVVASILVSTVHSSSQKLTSNMCLFNKSWYELRVTSVVPLYMCLMNVRGAQTFDECVHNLRATSCTTAPCMHLP